MVDVQVYTTNYCPYCKRAKQLLASKGVEYSEIDVTSDKDERKRLIERTGGMKTVPQIFIGDEHIGGFDDLYALDKAGELDAKLGLN